MRYHFGLGIGHVGIDHSQVSATNFVTDLDSDDLDSENIMMDIDGQPQGMDLRCPTSNDGDMGPYPLEVDNQPNSDHHESSSEDEDDLDHGSGSGDDYDTSQAVESDPGSESLGSELEYDD